MTRVHVIVNTDDPAAAVTEFVGQLWPYLAYVQKKELLFTMALSALNTLNVNTEPDWTPQQIETHLAAYNRSIWACKPLPLQLQSAQLVVQHVARVEGLTDAAPPTPKGKP